jgi:hypothetical protein
MGILKGLGLSIQVYTPLVQGGGWLMELADVMDSYSHEVGADMGCLSADLAFSCRFDQAVDWLTFGLGRHIEVSNPGGEVIWEGLVDVITLSIGADVVTYGPLFDIGNRVYVIYTPLYVSSTVADGYTSRGTSMESPLMDDTVSQGRFGIIEKSLSAGTCVVSDTQNEAELARDTFLAENAYPKLESSLSINQQEAPRISLGCIGYWKWLDAYIWNNRTTAGAYGYSTTDAKIRTVLAANPNAFSISADYGNIQANTAIVYNQEKDNKTALTIIRACAAAGDPNADRWLFGVAPGRRPYFCLIPSEIEYEYRMVDNRQLLYHARSGQQVQPWDIQPGKWLSKVDFPSVPALGGSLRADPRNVLIEKARYDAPYSFSLAEARIGKVSQMLAYKQNLGIM